MPSRKRLPSLRNRAVRLACFTGLALISAYLLANSLLAWNYVSRLTHPDCPPPGNASLSGYLEDQIHTPDGLLLPVRYYPPKNGAVILALGGLGGSVNQPLPKIDYLVESGYGVLQIGSRACARPAGLVTLGAKETLDAVAGLDYVLARPEVKQVGIIGFSMGGAGAIRTAARRPEIIAVVAEGGYYNLGKNFIQPDTSQSPPMRLFLWTAAYLFWWQTGENPWQVSPLEDLPRLSPRPVLLVYGEHEINNGHGQLQYEAARQPKTLWLVRGGDHGVNHLVAPGEYEARIGSFFDRYLLKP